MATAARSLPSWVVLDPVVSLHKSDEKADQDWAIIRCETKAYVTLRADVEGTRPDDELSPFDGLKLLVFVTDPPWPSRLSIRLDGDPDKEERRGFDSQVLLADGGFLVLSSCLPDTRGSNSYLVCDATNASLKMFRTLPSRFRPSMTCCPLPIRQSDGDGGYLLVLVAMDMDAAGGYLPAVVCLLPSSLPFGHPWQTRRAIFPSEKRKLFTAHRTFLFQGRAFWVDLGQGILFCSCEDLMYGNNDVQFGYIQPPAGCYVDYDPLLPNALPSEYRDVRCVGDSIKFVSIEGYNTLPHHNMFLSMWKLIPSSGEWHKIASICVGSLWEQEGFRMSGLPTNTPPTQPMLSSEEDEDGVVYFLLGDFFVDDKYRTLHVFSLNMMTCKFVSAWHLPPWRHMGPPSLMGSDIFKHLKKHYPLPLVPTNTRDKVFPVPPKRDLCESKVHEVLRKRVQRDHHEAGSSGPGKGGLERWEDEKGHRVVV